MYETDIHIFKYTLNQIYFKSIKYIYQYLFNRFITCFNIANTVIKKILQ